MPEWALLGESPDPLFRLDHPHTLLRTFFFSFLCHKVVRALESEGTLSRDLTSLRCLEGRLGPSLRG